MKFFFRCREKIFSQQQKFRLVVSLVHLSFCRLWYIMMWYRQNQLQNTTITKPKQLSAYYHINPFVTY